MKIREIKTPRSGVRCGVLGVPGQDTCVCETQTAFEETLPEEISGELCGALAAGEKRQPEPGENA